MAHKFSEFCCHKGYMHDLTAIAEFRLWSLLNNPSELFEQCHFLVVDLAYQILSLSAATNSDLTKLRMHLIISCAVPESFVRIDNMDGYLMASPSSDARSFVKIDQVAILLHKNSVDHRIKPTAVE